MNSKCEKFKGDYMFIVNVEGAIRKSDYLKQYIQLAAKSLVDGKQYF